MAENINLWREAGHALDYLKKADSIPHRREGEAALLDCLPASVPRFLDLGSGDGRLLRLVKLQHPNAQAMALDVPVIAYAAAAVPETMGGSGLLVHDWDAPRVAELMHLTLTEATLRARVLASQRANLQRFTEAEARRRLAAVVAYLQTGETSPLFVYRSPG